ncbi:response regulator transcription factor [Aliiroseovarius sp. S1339]|uniref:response regulator transcription factor n=1 Tax=Aliiroseovarius sp. S1339 TaxID=2936990 RepID=UPI0020BD4BBD|nr:response regulator transcription factor [Aliiroseovarius sp. S1339]MCK8464019.1 response regulator transcription factor [Aliiroseovarius sp. S1339]
MAERILVVDDDRQLTSFLDRFLSKQGYRVTTAGTASQMGLAMEHQEFNLIVLDIGLPDGDGFELTREFRKHSNLPIIVLTARDDVFDRVIGLELGADDYITKPFEPRELLARVKSVLRRSGADDAPVLEGAPERYRDFSGFRIDLVSRMLSLRDDGTEINVTSTEYALLLALTDTPGKVLARSEILEALYGNSTAVTDRAIDAHMVRLRRKLGQGDGEAPLIRTVHGVGYTIAASILNVS